MRELVSETGFGEAEVGETGIDRRNEIRRNELAELKLIDKLDFVEMRIKRRNWRNMTRLCGNRRS